MARTRARPTLNRTATLPTMLILLDGKRPENVGRAQVTSANREEQQRGFEGRLHVGCQQFHIIYVSVNAIAARRRRRTRDAIASVRHVFLDADHMATLSYRLFIAEPISTTRATSCIRRQQGCICSGAQSDSMDSTSSSSRNNWHTNSAQIPPQHRSPRQRDYPAS
jgi:hypothetical protein